ncbi:MAG TPA: methyltransferase domain-containing protein [Acidimicrobiales bacterium]|nr:methyltransferase domain-containing protein [Acidimicrobiales bacterium]
MSDPWDPGVYERFAAERRRPFTDIVALVDDVPGGHVVDLGCGPGGLTVDLHLATGAASTVGVDNSPTMIETARERHGALPGLAFELGDIATWAGEGADLITALASLHWLDDHETILERLVAQLLPGGQLAAQVPAAFDHASHRVAAEVAAESPFAEALAPDPPVGRQHAVLSPGRYSEILDELGATDQHVRLQVYGHRLDSSADVVEWVRGTLFTPYRARLDDETFSAFVDRYRQRLLEVLGDHRPYYFAFPRILFWARFG